MLIMQFFWVYIDDMLGKGISVWVILELIFYVSAGVVPLALPLAVLLSSVMTLGNLAEKNELTALKSAGLSLFKILKPLTIVIVFISLGAFYFSNYIIPVANLKWHSIIYDIQNTKISAIVKPGAYSDELEGYSIKVGKEKDASFEDILIHDHSSPKELKTVRAQKGKMYKSVNGKYLFLDLLNGDVSEELNTENPIFLNSSKLQKNPRNKRPSRRSSFKKATYKIELEGLGMNRSNENLFVNKHEMMNVFQIAHVIDSIKKRQKEIIFKFSNGIKRDHPYFSAQNTASKLVLPSKGPKNKIAPKKALIFDDVSKEEKLKSILMVQTKLRRKNQTLKNQGEYAEVMNKDMNSYWLEFHRKFALTYAILVLFFIGAPLGAIVKKGGFGTPVIIASLLFMVYFVLISIGQNLVESETLSPFWGMWLAGFVLTPIAFFITRAASKDKSISFKSVRVLKALKLFKKK